MRLPAIQGVIDRRILANYHVDPDVMRRVLPEPFRPKLVGGWAIAGVCLIRLKHIRPRFLPLPVGVNSENAAHRVAVEWQDGSEKREGVYIPRRDTSSWANVLAGGTIFSGIHHHAVFAVRESSHHVSVSLDSDDGKLHLQLAGSVTDRLPTASAFPSLDDASAFFERGGLGYSATRDPGRFDGLELRCHEWHVEPLDVERLESSFFEDTALFPANSVEFDCALLMRGIRHEWHGRGELCCPVTKRA